MTFLFLQLFFVLASTLNLCTAIQTVNKSCKFVSNSYGPSRSGTCFHISKEAMTWQDAHGLCHSSQGWLLNCVYENIDYLDPNEIKLKGILSLWSGHHVRNRRLLADNFPTVQSAGTFTNFTLSTISGNPLCVLQVYNGTCKVRLTKRQAQAGDDGPQCKDSYTKVFAPCDQKHFFVCMFEVKIDYSGVMEYQGSTSTIRSETLPVDFYMSYESVAFDQKDGACNRTLQYGNAFRVTSDYERQMFSSYGYTASSLGYIKNETELFWLNGGDDDSCRAAIGDFSRLGQTEYTTLPCSMPLRVFCQLNKVYDDTPPPKLRITANWPRVIANGNEIQAPSTLARQFGSFSNAYASPIQKNVSIECVTSIGQLQGVTFYRNGIPVSSNVGWPATGHYFDLEVQNYADTVSSVSDIDLNQYFHCEVNNLKDGSTQQSDFVFIRLTDYEIYSLHIDLMSNAMADTLAVVMLKASLLNQWTPQTFVASGKNSFLNPPQTSPATRSLLNGSTLADLQSSLDDVVRIWRGWMIKPVLFTLNSNEERKSLVAYLYQKVSEAHTVQDMNETKLNLASRTMADLFQQSQNKLPQFNVTSVQVRSIDWCWPVTVLDNITNDKYHLPRSTMGTVWKSPNTCAQDRQPLVTIECEGDKIIGLDWGQVHVNPLCDYSANNSGRTNATYRLQALAQSTITALNVEEIVNQTRQTILELDVRRFIPEDVRYIADIFQKSNDVGATTSATVQGMLDVAAFLRNFPDHVLAESQRLGNATNRILKSLDQLGRQVELGPEQDNQRITSGGVGLEVWDLRRNDDTHLAVGIKILSGDDTEVLTSESLKTLFKKDEVDYDHADVAILLPNDYIKALMSEYTGSNIRLSMNVYSDTTLFKNSVVVSNISKPSLNSRVIAAQLLLDGQPVTDLGPSTVQTVFLPDKKVPRHLRSNLTTCAFWDFEAESGAGGWSSQGCVYNQTIDGRDVCVCDHLTNFAVLMSFYDQESLNNENELALTIISIVGLSLSIIGLSLSILSFLLIKRVRHGRPQQTLFQLCLALLMSWVVFLAGVTQTSSHAGCIAVAALLHYFILSSFMWMLMEGILQYLLFVKVMNTYFTHYMWKTSIPAWGLPVIPVAIVLIIDPGLYRGGNKYCWMSLPAFYYSFAIPVGLIVLTNIVIFIIVVVSLCRRKNMTKHSTSSQNQIVVNIRASFVCFCVLGLSWIFGFLAIDDARIVFQYIFCISVSLQGFVIFAMMTARDKNVRAFWSPWFCFFCKRGGYSVPEVPSPKSTSSELPQLPSSGSSSTNSTTASDSAEFKTRTGISEKLVYS